MTKGRKMGFYMNSDLAERLENLKGARVLLKRHDAVGNPYMDEIRVPSNPQTAIRSGLDLFLDLAERQAVIDETQHTKED
jgi:hypothetical protein